MVFNFPLPTTSHFSFQSHLSSRSHPSLPQAATAARHALRQALKKHKRLTPVQRSSHLSLVLAALNEYVPYLDALSQGLNRPDSDDDGGITVLLHNDIETSWRPILNANSSISIQRLGQKNTRAKGRGINYELGFVLSSLGYVHSSLARTRCLTTLYALSTPTPEQKSAAVTSAMKDLLVANSIHRFLASLTFDTLIPDLDPSAQSALASLALAEATLLAVLKDDAYLSYCIQSRNEFDNEWMVKPPDIPKVRALLFVRLCVRGAEHAEQAAASLGAVEGRNEEVLGYMQVLARVARAKACRFFGIDAELAGKAGEGIAWLRAGRAALGGKGSSSLSLGGDVGGPSEAAKGRGKGRIGGGLSRLKKEWSERREEKKVGKEAGSSKSGSDGVMEADLDWGDDAGRDEELKVIDMLESKWMSMNNMVNTQAIPSSASYLSNLPSGRDIHTPPAPFVAPQLDADQLVRMYAPPDRDQQIEDVSSSDDDVHKSSGHGYY